MGPDAARRACGSTTARRCWRATRWPASAAGPGGRARARLMARTDELSAPDDRTIRFRLREPFPLLPLALGKVQPNMLAIMPERLAARHRSPRADRDGRQRPVPLRGRRGGARRRYAYQKFDGYVPRAAGGLADGGAEGGQRRPRGVAHHPRPGHRPGRPAIRRDGLVGAPGVRPAAHHGARPQPGDLEERPAGRAQHPRAEPRAAAVRQPGRAAVRCWARSARPTRCRPWPAATRHIGAPAIGWIPQGSPWANDAGLRRCWPRRTRHAPSTLPDGRLCRASGS